MRIVVLDGHALNPGDMSWQAVEALGQCRVYPQTQAHEVLDRVREAEIILTNKVALPRGILEQLPQLKLIGVMATGYDIVDIQAARERNVVVTNVPAYGTASVAQLTIAHILNLTHHVGEHAASVRRGRWLESADFCYWEFPLIELSGLTLGLVGLGAIGTQVATVAQAFGMHVLATVSRPRREPAGVKLVELDQLFRESDIVSLHCPLTPQTKQLVCAERLALMKPSALLINTSRGGLIDDQALADALNRGQIAGAGLDVLKEEPPRSPNPLFSARNCYITPHFGWATKAARERLFEVVIANIAAFLGGEPINVVNRN